MSLWIRYMYYVWSFYIDQDSFMTYHTKKKFYSQTYKNILFFKDVAPTASGGESQCPSLKRPRPWSTTESRRKSTRKRNTWRGGSSRWRRTASGWSRWKRSCWRKWSRRATGLPGRRIGKGCKSLWKLKKKSNRKYFFCKIVQDYSYMKPFWPAIVE